MGEGAGGGTRTRGRDARATCALVGDSELPNAFARSPGVDEVGAPAIGEKGGPGERFVVGGGDEQRIGDVLQRLLAVRDDYHAGVAGGAEGVREAADMVEAVGGEVAVVDEEDVQGREVMNLTEQEGREGREGSSVVCAVEG